MNNLNGQKSHVLQTTSPAVAVLAAVLISFTLADPQLPALQQIIIIIMYYQLNLVQSAVYNTELMDTVKSCLNFHIINILPCVAY